MGIPSRKLDRLNSEDERLRLRRQSLCLTLCELFSIPMRSWNGLLVGRRTTSCSQARILDHCSAAPGSSNSRISKTSRRNGAWKENELSSSPETNAGKSVENKGSAEMMPIAIEMARRDAATGAPSDKRAIQSTARIKRAGKKTQWVGAQVSTSPIRTVTSHSEVISESDIHSEFFSFHRGSSQDFHRGRELPVGDF